MSDVACDVLVIGGSLGGVAAALRAAAMGAKVCLVEESGWLGGQLTGQGVCTPDENQWIDSVGATASYRALRHQIRQYYRDHFKLSAAGAALPMFDVGRCWVNTGFAVQPLLGHKLLLDNLNAVGNVTLFLNTRIVDGDIENDSVVSLTGADASQQTIRFTASFFLDATDLGTLLPLLNVEHTLGAESKAQTGEPHAAAVADKSDVQPITFPFAIERRPVGESHRIPKPEGYEAIKAAQNFGSQFGACESGIKTFDSLWTYRRFIYSGYFNDPAFPFDLSMINTDCNDYHEGVIPSGEDSQDVQTLANAQRTSACYLYWLQTECQRSDDSTKQGYPELRPAEEIFNTQFGIAPLPYIRESRRIQALFTVKEQDIWVGSNPGERATLYADSCGIGFYPMDVHGGDFGVDSNATNPFQIPLGALIPVRVKNLLAACKNAGMTHITNGAYRLHPIEWNIGEAAGALAAFCLTKGATPQSVYSDQQLGGSLQSYQQAILAQGVPLFWWTDVSQTDPHFGAIHMMGVLGIFEGFPHLQYGPTSQLTSQQRQAVSSTVLSKYNKVLQWPGGPMTRAEAADWILKALIP